MVVELPNENNYLDQAIGFGYMLTSGLDDRSLDAKAISWLEFLSVLNDDNLKFVSEEFKLGLPISFDEFYNKIITQYVQTTYNTSVNEFGKLLQDAKSDDNIYAVLLATYSLIQRAYCEHTNITADDVDKVTLQAKLISEIHELSQVVIQASQKLLDQTPVNKRRTPNILEVLTNLSLLYGDVTYNYFEDLKPRYNAPNLLSPEFMNEVNYQPLLGDKKIEFPRMVE